MYLKSLTPRNRTADAPTPEAEPLKKSAISIDMEKLYLHAVIIDKSIGLVDAKKSARKIMDKAIGMYRATDESYRFRNIPKKYFKTGSFRAKKINDKVTLVFGHLKKEYLVANEETGDDKGTSTASQSASESEQKSD